MVMVSICLLGSQGKTIGEFCSCKKFCAVTQFDSVRLQESGFKPTFTLEEGLTRTLQYEFGFEDKKSY